MSTPTATAAVTDAEDAAPRPRVTVVIATRDRPVLLARAVQAVFDQDYDGEVECVVVFDQSEPAPIAVGPRPGRSLATIRNTRTPGLPGARNSGVLVATGTLIGFCDDDDEWLPAKLSRQVGYLTAHPDAAVVSSGVLVQYDDTVRRRLPPARDVTFADLLDDRIMELHPSTVLVRKAAMLGPIGLVDEEIPGGYGEDYEWLLRAAMHRDIAAVHEPLVRVHWHASSFFAERWQTIISALEYLLERYPSFADSRPGYARIAGQIAFAEASRGRRRDAARWSVRSLRSNWHEQRAVAALLVASGAISTGRVMRLAHRLGRGI